MKYYITKNIEQVKKSIKYLSKFKYLSLDCESTGLERFSDIIGISFSSAPNEGFYIPFCKSPTLENYWTVHEEREVLDLIQGLITQEDINLIYHHAAYDIIRLANKGLDGMSRLYFDTMIAKHLLEEDSNRVRHGLKNCGEYYLGIPPDEQKDLEESVKKNGGRWLEKDKEFFKADLEPLGKYACMDVNLTIQLFYKFYKMLKEENLLDYFFKKCMPQVKVTAEMESTGIEIDINYCKCQKESLENNIENIDSDIYNELQKDYSKSIMRVEKDLLDKKYPINDNPKFYKCLLTSLGIKIPVKKNGTETLEKKALEKLKEETNNHPIILWKLKELTLDEIWYKFEEDLLLTQKNLYFQDNPEETRVFNFNSNQQMADLLYNKLGETPPKLTKGGSPSTDIKTLESFADKYTFMHKIRLRNKMFKALTSYINRFLYESIDGRYYPSFDQVSTVTGRYGSDFQQLPRPDKEDVEFNQGELVKKAIITKSGYKLIACDFPNLEIRIIAHLAQEPALIEAFKRGEDPYGALAVILHDLDCEPNEVKSLYPKIRQETKNLMLGTNYGKGPYSLAIDLGLGKDKSFEEIVKAGKNILDSYFGKFKKIKLFQDRCKSLASNAGYVKTLMGKKRRLPEAKKLKFKQDKKSRGHYNHIMRQAINAPVQGLAEEITTLAMIKYYKLRNKYKLDSSIVLQIHDEIVTETREDHAEKSAKLLKHCMETAFKLCVDLPVEPKIGNNMMEVK